MFDATQRILGRRASRNKGVDESSAEYVLFLDDDVIPEPDVLEAYGTALKTQVLDSKYELVGLILDFVKALFQLGEG